MRGLTSNEVLAVWELGMGQSPVRRALTMLGPVCSGETPQSLQAWSLGQRDALLLELRECTFGAHLSSLADCPHCSELVQADFTIRDVQVAAPTNSVPVELDCAGFAVRLKLLDSVDLEAAAAKPDPQKARRELVTRCVTGLHGPNGEAVPVSTLPEELIAAIGARLSEADPQADVVLTLDCPACGHHWEAPFDIASFLWTELQACARRLLAETHELAAAYGWSENDILALTPARRAAYLGLVRG